MNIIQVQERLKDVSDDQLQQMMQQPGAMAPEFLVMAELNRRKRMREGYEAAQAQNDTTVAQDLLAAPGIPQAVGNQMAAAMRPEGAQTRAGIAGMASGGVVGLQEGGFPPLPVRKPESVAQGLSTEVSSVMFDRLRALGIDPATLDVQVIRQIEAESSGNPTAKARKGIVNRDTGKMEYARGLMQALPSTAEDPGYNVPNIREVARSLGVDPTGMSTVQLLENPQVNLAFGMAYRQGMFDEFGGDSAKGIAAYHAGPGNVKRKGVGNIGPQNTEYVEKLAGGATAPAHGTDMPDIYAPALPARTTPVYTEEELNIVSAAPKPEKKKGLLGLGFLGLAPGGAIPTGPDDVSYPTVLPQPKPAGIGYRTSEPSESNLERLRKYEEKYGPIPEATAPTKDSQSWADWLYNVFNPRSDAQRKRDAYVPTVESSNMFGTYAGGGIVQGMAPGGLVSSYAQLPESVRARAVEMGLTPQAAVNAYNENQRALNQMRGINTPTPAPTPARLPIVETVGQLPTLPSLTPPEGSMGTVNLDAIPQWAKEAFGAAPAPADTGLLRDLPTVTPRTPSYRERFGPLPKERSGPTPANAYVSTPQLDPYTPDPNELSLISNQRGLGFGAIADALEIKDPEGARSPFARAIGDPLRSYFSENARKAAGVTEDIRRENAAAQGLMNNPLARQLGSPWAGGGIGEFFTPRTDEEFAQARQLKAIADALGQTDLSPAEVMKVTSSEDLMRYAPILDAEDPSAAARQIYYGEEPPTPGEVGESVITPGAPTTPTPAVPAVPAVPTVTPTAKTMPAPPNVDTPPIPTAPVVSLPAASTPAMPSAPKTPAEAYTMTQVLAGAPAGDAASREARRNAFMALAKFGLTLAGSKEATAGGAIAKAGLGALDAYEAGAEDIRNRALAAQKEAYQRQKDQMAMKQALSKEEYQRYRDLVRDAQIAAERGDNQAWRQAQLKLDVWKTRVAEQRAQATAEASLVSAEMKASKERADLLSQERAYLSSPGFIASIAQLPKAQQEIARQGAERRREYIDAEMNKFLGYSGLGQAPMPGTADLTK